MLGDLHPVHLGRPVVRRDLVLGHNSLVVLGYEIFAPFKSNKPLLSVFYVTVFYAACHAVITQT